MARGWESKSVEDQIGAAEAVREIRAAHELSAEQREQSERKQSLMLSRALIVSRMKAARDERYRAQLKVALDQLDEQLREIEGEWNVARASRPWITRKMRVLRLRIRRSGRCRHLESRIIYRRV